MDDDLNRTDRDILRLLKAGRCTPRYLANELDLQQPYVSQRLRRLVEHNRVRRVDRGLYELTTGEMIHVSEDLADELYSMKGRGSTYEDLLRKLVETSGSDPAPAEQEPEAAAETARKDVETPSSTLETSEESAEDTPEVDPETTSRDVEAPSSTPETSDESAEDTPEAPPVLEELREELPGTGVTSLRRAEAILSMANLLREKGSAEKSDFLEVVDAEDVGYETPELMWSKMVKGRDTLRALARVEPPAKGETTWEYRDNV
jgi:DNA-binding Lrp family transcriptional regulator